MNELNKKLFVELSSVVLLLCIVVKYLHVSLMLAQFSLEY